MAATKQMKAFRIDARFNLDMVVLSSDSGRIIVPG
jgi:hypothetical protein